MSLRPRLLLLPLLASLASAPAADLLVGKVVDSNGVGVPGVDIDIEDAGGGDDPPIFNDGTDALGNFAVTVPAGFYDVIFNPPPPPATTHLILTVEEVVIVGTTNVGTVVLPPGVALSGRCVNESGLPVPGINLDVIDETNGDNLDLIGDTSDSLGMFAIAVPAGPIEVRFDTNLYGSALAPQAFPITPSGDVNVGDVVLPPGRLLSGQLVGPGGAPVVNADVDVEDVATGIELYTPGDNTNGSGVWDVVVPAGLYDIEICPPSGGPLLVGAGVSGVSVAASDVNVGVSTALAGVQITGTVLSFDGSPVVGADIDVENAGTLADYVLCGDNTQANGSYSVVGPLGVTVNVQAEPPGFSLPLGSAETFGINLTGSTVVDHVLPSCPFHTNYGSGLAGTGGITPHLGSTGGAPRVGNNGYGFSLEDGVGGAPAVLVAGLLPASIPQFGGTIHVSLGSLLLNQGLALGGAPGAAGAGAASLLLPTPIVPGFVGVTIYSQFGVFDAGAPQGFALSEGMSFTFCP